MGKGSKITAGVCVLATAALLAVGTKRYLESTEKKIAELEERVASMKEDCVPMRFELVQKTDSAMSVQVSMYDVQTGNSAGKSKVFDLSGEELNVDFQVIKLSDENYIFFPYGLYTDTMRMVDSEKLFALYDENGFPAIYAGLIDAKDDGADSSQEDRLALSKTLTDYFAVVKEGAQSQAEEQYGTAIHDLKTISQFKTGFVYEVLCHPHTGGIEIRKDN